MVIRPATVDDADSLVELRLALLREMGMEENRTPGERENMARILEGYFRDAIPGGYFMAWVVEIGGKLVATSGLVFLQKPPVYGNYSGREAYIMNMYTLPQYRKRGYGTLLMKEMIKYLRVLGIERVSLHYTDDGLPLYEKFGFKPYSREMRLQLPNE